MTNFQEGRELSMREMKRGDYARIIKPVLIRRKSGIIESLDGKIVQIIEVGFKKCRCDIGAEKPVSIPKSHLEAVA